MFKKLLPTLFILVLFGLITACKKDEDPKPAPPSTPTTFEFDGFSANTVQAKAHTTALSTLTSEMIKTRTITNRVTAETLRGIYTAGSPSLADITEPVYRDSINVWLGQIAAISGTPFDTLNYPNANGGVTSGRLFNGLGVELDQLVEKGLFGAALFRRACIEHLSGTITAADIDQAFVYYGADVKFPKDDTKDLYAARYAVRRDKNRGDNGHYAELKKQFIAARVAAAANNTTAANQAALAIKKEWERVLSATVINYLYSVNTTLSLPNITFAQRASAWHAWAEAVGFLNGMRAVPAEHRVITDAQIDEVLNLIKGKYPHGIANGFNTPTDLQALQTAINRLASIHNFPDPSIYR